MFFWQFMPLSMDFDVSNMAIIMVDVSRVVISVSGRQINDKTQGRQCVDHRFQSPTVMFLSASLR